MDNQATKTVTGRIVQVLFAAFASFLLGGYVEHFNGSARAWGAVSLGVLAVGGSLYMVIRDILRQQ